MKNLLLFGFTASVFLIISTSSVFAYPISATSNKIIYEQNDTLTITGTIGTTDVVSLTATFYDSNNTAVNSTSGDSSGGTPNEFTLTHDLDYSPGDYYALVTDGTDSVNISFKIVSELLFMDAFFIDYVGVGDVISVSTDTPLTSGELDFNGGNFTELVDLSLSGTVQYGNETVYGTLYHFVLVDETDSGTYDRLYIDDDTEFEFYNDTEDTGEIEYQSLRKGNAFDNGTFKYIIGEIERSTGEKLILFNPADNKPPFSTSDTANILVIVSNSTHLLDGESVSVVVRNSAGSNVTPTTTHTTNSFGCFNTSKTFTNLTTGVYVLDLNDTLNVISFPVEAFKLFVTTADLSSNPTNEFAPNSPVRIIITSKNTTGPINLDSFTVNVYYPNSTVDSLTGTDFEQITTGRYRYDLNLEGAPIGSYSITVSATFGSDTQETTSGFSVQSIDFMAEAINPRYIDEAESGGAMVNAFPPNSNVSIMTFLFNVSAGGGMGKEGEFTGLLTVPDCSEDVTLEDVRDENGVSYIDSINYSVMNLSEALTYLEAEEADDIPQDLLSQCMVIFESPNKTGIYNAEVKIDYEGEEKYTGVIFGIQRLYARGATVDFKGDDFGFFAPNATIRIKLKVRDLVTDEELPAENITTGKIIELEKVYPDFLDIMANSTLRNNLNESINNGTIIFTSPPFEGFYFMKFRFTADVDGTLYTGLGDAFFMLKKYMMWGELYGADRGNWYVAQGQNITLSVTILDIDLAQSIFGGYSEQKTCTGCSNFTIGISELRNDQLFKTIPDTDYSVQQGFISNSSNPVTNVTIVPSASMDTGWYSVDLLANDTSTGDTYFGWGWFEIRNFWVDALQATYDDSGDFFTFTPEWGDWPIYPIGDPIYFVVLPHNATPPYNMFEPDQISLESVMDFDGWPPMPMDETDYTYSINKETVKMCMGDEEEQTCFGQGDRYVINLTSENFEGEYEANVKIWEGTVSDIGTFRFSAEEYQIITEYRQESWPPMFAPTENLSVNFTAMDFDENPVNLTNVTINHLFSIKKERPIRMKYGQNYTSNCTGNFCQTHVYINNLPNGEYVIMFEIEDAQGEDVREEIFFMVKDTVIGIPSIEEGWIHETETVSKKIERDVRRGDWSWCQDLKESIPNASLFCGDYCPDGPGCTEYNLTVPNVTSEKEISRPDTRCSLTARVAR